MKAKFFALLAVVLAVVSCQKDVDNLDVNMGGDVATISVALPADAITRAAADKTDSAWSGLQNEDGEKMTVTLYIFDENGIPSVEPYTQTLEENDLVANFEVRLVPDRNYRFVAWAGQVGAEDNFTINTPNYKDWNIALNDWAAMNESRDAFTGYLEVEKFNSAKTIPTLELTRPFAKLRVITTDMEWITNNNVNPTYAEVSYEVALPSSINAYSQTINDNEPFAKKLHNTFAIKDYTEDADGEMTLFTDYILAPMDGSVVKFILKVYEDDSKNRKLITSTSFTTDIPVKRNNLTTIKGDILTDGNNINVEVKPEFGDEGYEWPSESAEKLAAAAMFGGVVTLTENVVLNQPLDVKSNMTINLGVNELKGVINVIEGAKLTVNNGTIVNEDKSKSGITSNGDLTLNDVTIESARHAVRIESGNVVINGGEYKVNPISKSTLHALNVGDDNTVANVTIKGGTFIGPKNTMADSGGAVAVRSGSTVTIEGGDFSGGKNKTLSANQGATLTVKGGTFDQNPSNYVAAGYKAIAADGIYYVLPETIANAAKAENVTAVTESTADVATALATNNSKATLFMWNDVAYIAKYGEVVITSAADEATTVRAVVESSTGLTRATVADGIEVVGNRTFRKCANLETVALPNTLTEIGPAVFQSCSKLANITIPESVTTIGEGAFAECTALTSINIPVGVTRIEKDALRMTALVSVEFHEGVTYFGDMAFRDCKQLKEVYINAPEFTIEPNAFGVMSGTLPGTTIYVANAEMKAYLKSTLSYANQFKIVAPSVVDDAEDLTKALAKGENVTLSQNVNTEAATTAPYGNKYAFKQDGGVIDGNGHELYMECYGDDYGIMTSGGTIKNLTITEGCRAVMIMYPQQDVVLDNVKIGGDGVLYPINTGEAGAEGVNLIVTNSVLAGWTSYGHIESASFKNVEFKQGTYYNNIYGRVLKPYVNTTLTNCSFVEHMNLDLSYLNAGHKIVMKNCTVNGQAVTVTTFTIPTTDAQYDTELFTIDLPSWATSINDCVVFE